MKKNTIIIFTLLFLAGVSSCVKEKFAAPAVNNVDPDITANTTIAQITAPLATTTVSHITQNQIISAVVVGDDKSGNLYKELAIEDSTGGILLMINGPDLYTTYPVGRRVFVNLEGLYVVSYDGQYEIVGSVNSDGSFTGISTANLSQYVTPGKWGITVAPKVVSITDFVTNVNAYQSELVQLNNVEFISGSRGVPYANGTYQLSASLSIKDCNENQATVYTSGYADFANSLTPKGNGTMLCIYGVYNATPQLMIRDTTDLNMTGQVCP